MRWSIHFNDTVPLSWSPWGCWDDKVNAIWVDNDFWLKFKFHHCKYYIQVILDDGKSVRASKFIELFDQLFVLASKETLIVVGKRNFFQLILYWFLNTFQRRLKNKIRAQKYYCVIFIVVKFEKSVSRMKKITCATNLLIQKGVNRVPRTPREWWRSVALKSRIISPIAS